MSYQLHLRCDSYNAAHAHLSVFINGKLCGKLTMSPDEANELHFDLVIADEQYCRTFPNRPPRFRSSGEFPHPTEESSQ